MENITIVKVGGKIVEEEATLKQLLSDFSAINGKKLLVHGGGRSATRMAERLGIVTKMVDGRRITDSDMLEVVTMVYGGLVNKRIVAGLQATGINALGMTGADMNIMLSDKREVKTIDYGWVGDVKRADGNALARLHDGMGNMLNTNADTMAGETAKALAPFFNVTLVFCFEKNGVLLNENDDNSVIPVINAEDYARLRTDGVVQGGMIPKLDNAFATLNAGVKEVVITNASHLGDLSLGTHIK